MIIRKLSTDKIEDAKKELMTVASQHAVQLEELHKECGYNVEATANTFKGPGSLINGLMPKAVLKSAVLLAAIEHYETEFALYL